MPIALYGHPFSPHTQKVLIALYENEQSFEFRVTTEDNPHHFAEWLRRWPIRKVPVLFDGDRTIPESSIILEHLQIGHPGPVRLLPDDSRAALEVRLMDRFFDLHVQAPIAQAMEVVMTGVPARRREALQRVAERLDVAYAWLESVLADRAWACGADFTMADCSAAPALCYADWTHCIGRSFKRVKAYRQRLIERPSFARVIREGRPYRMLFPLGAPTRD